MDCANVVQNVIVLNIFAFAYACRLLCSLHGAGLFYRGTVKEAQADYFLVAGSAKERSGSQRPPGTQTLAQLTSMMEIIQAIKLSM